jgi:RNA polymerase sigma-70 factor (ECF subfamily)
MSGKDEAELIARAREGDRGAFESLLRPLIDPGYRLAYTILGRRPESEDAVQEAALKAWTNIGQLREGAGSLRAWFLAIVVNQCRMTRRSRWWSVVPVEEPQRAGTQGDEHLVERSALRQALDELSDQDRLIVFLYYGVDLGLDDIARVLGLTPAGAKTRLYRAVRRLRPAMGVAEAPA